MTDVSLDREALRLFDALMVANPADADAWLAEKAAGRPDLLSRVRQLLEAENQLTLRTGGAVDYVGPDETPPERLAGYLIIERIGAGGMGSVYLGRRDRGDFEHLAAIKVIRPGLLSERLVERFRRERQILAALRHPNIAQLFDGGETEDGSPYIIMEYVDGLPLLQWAEETKAGRTERVDKLLQACAAVSFAHANLIVHRDITPTNVLVTKAGVAKLIDFGIARPAHAGTERRGSTGSGSLATLSLTPGFAAPERMTGAEPTTAADVFSLGMLASKLLEPNAGDRDLEAIVAKATAHQPEDRYASVELLAEDLRAWRDGYPISVFRGRRGYGFNKFLGRHRRATWAGAAAAVALLGAFAGTGVAWRMADGARAAEARRFEDVRALAKYLLFDLNEKLRSVPGNTTARADLAAKAQSYLDALEKTPDASRSLRLETAQGLVKLAEIQNSPLDRNLGQTDAAKRNLARARAILTRLRAEADGPEIAIAEARIAAIMSLIVFYKDADAKASEAEVAAGEAALARVAEKDRTREWRWAQRDLSRAQIDRYSGDEKFEELVTGSDRHDALIDAWPPEERTSEQAFIEHAFAKYNRGLGWAMQGDNARGFPEMRAAHDDLAAAEKKAQSDPDLLYYLAWAGMDGYAAAAGADKADEGEYLLASARNAAARLVAIEDRDESARVLNYTAGEAYSQHLRTKGRFKEAIAEQQKIVASRIAEMDPTGPGVDVAWSEMILGMIARDSGERALACKSFTDAEARFTKADAAGRLIAFQQAFLPGLRASVDLCKRGRPLSEFKPLR